MKSLENYNQNDLKKMAGRTGIVQIKNKTDTDYTLTKKATTTISRDLTSLQNSFNKIISNSKNIKSLQDSQSKLNQNNMNVVPVAMKVVGADQLTDTVKYLSKYFEHLTKIVDKLDLSPTTDTSEENGDGTGKKGKKNRRNRKRRGRGRLGKVTGAISDITDVSDSLDISDEISGSSITSKALKIGGGLVVAGVAAMAGSSFMLDKPEPSKAAPTTKIPAKESPAEKQLRAVVSRTVVPPAKREPTEISSDSYSSRFADYLSDTFKNVKGYIGGIVGKAIGGGGGGGNAGDGAGYDENAKIAMDYFMSPQGGGWTQEQAAGIVANLQAESGVRPWEDSPPDSAGRTADGIAQWRGPRKAKFQEKYGKPVLQGSLQEQLEFVNWELNNTHRNAGSSLRTATTAEQAATIVYKQYEIPGDEDTSGGQRISNALALMAPPPNTSGPLSGGQLMNPLPGYAINSEFGMRMHPTKHVMKMHEGLDFAAPMGTSVKSAGSGNVVFVGTRGGYGNVVEIDHGGGILTRYAHLSAFSVSQGAPIQGGQEIGKVGSTGQSTGAHLHFEVHRNGRKENPRPFITGKTQSASQPIQNPVISQALNDIRSTPRRGNGSLLIVRQAAPPPSPPVLIPFGGNGPRINRQNPNHRESFLGYHGY